MSIFKIAINTMATALIDYSKNLLSFAEFYTELTNALRLGYYDFRKFKTTPDLETILKNFEN